MVDFNKIREERKAQIEAVKKQPTKIIAKPPSYHARFNHLIEYHLGEMTGWEETFVYNNRNEIVSRKLDEEAQGRFFTDRVKNKLKELEDTYCGVMCHALQKGGIPHA